MAATLLAVTPASALSSNSSGSAAQDINSVLNATTTPDVFRNATSQPAGNLVLTPDPTDPQFTGAAFLRTGEQIRIQVDDNEGVNCSGVVAEDFIGIVGTPTATVVGTAEVAVDVVTTNDSNSTTNDDPIGPRATTPGADCAGFSPAVRDMLVVRVTSSGSVQSLTIGGIQYQVGALANVGPVMISAIDEPPPGGGPAVNNDDVNFNGYSDSGGDTPTSGIPFSSNAYVTNLKVTANTPPKGFTPGAGRAISDIVLQEMENEATTPQQDDVTTTTVTEGTSGSVCVAIESGNATFAANPTVNVTAGNDTAGGISRISVDGTPNLGIRFQVVEGVPTAKSTFTITGLQINTEAGEFGPVNVNVYQCDPGLTNIVTTTAPYVGPPSLQPITDDPTPGDLPPGTADNDIAQYNGSPVKIAAILRVRRFAGADRYATARVIAERGVWNVDDDGDNNGNGCASQVVLSRGDLFPDALSGNYFAGDRYAPILLSNVNSLPQDTLEALRNLGVLDVYITGGTNAISDAVAKQLDDMTSYECGGGSPRRDEQDTIMTLNVIRLAGVDRYDTARRVAEAPGRGGADGTGGPGRVDLVDDGTDFPLRTAILASGENFPDALAAGPMAWQGQNNFCSEEGEPNGGDDSECRGFPLLLTPTASLSPFASAALQELDIQQVIIVGGVAAVSQSVEDALKASGLRVVRLFGADRQGTAAAIHAFEQDLPVSVAPGGANNPLTKLDANNQGLGWLEHSHVPVDEDIVDKPDGDGTEVPDSTQYYANLARGDNFPDALTFGPHAGNEYASILLTQDVNTLGATTTAVLAGQAKLGAFSLHIAGGTAAVSSAVETAATSALGS